MYAGKTEAVIRIARRYEAINKKVLFVNHNIDTRYSKDSFVVSHNGTKKECVKLDFLRELETSYDFENADVVIIEEAQFFQDIYEFIKKHLFTKKKFIVSGLSGDTSLNPIGDILRLIPMAENVEKLNGLCQICNDGTIGSFTRRKGTDVGQIIVGGKELYSCVCISHFICKSGK